MKKLNSKKLELSQSTIRLLSSQELSTAAGGGITPGCTTGCSATTACHCFPKTMYPTE
jgi:natural product precursor